MLDAANILKAATAVQNYLCTENAAEIWLGKEGTCLFKFSASYYAKTGLLVE